MNEDVFLQAITDIYVREQMFFIPIMIMQTALLDCYLRSLFPTALIQTVVFATNSKLA